MGNCKIVYNDEVLIDLSNDSVTPETLDEGVTAHDKDGNPIVGTRSVSGAQTEDLTAELTEQAEKIEELLTVLDSKAAGGSGSYETCTLEINTLQSSDPDTYCYIDSVVYPILDEQGNVIYQITYPGTYSEIQNVVVGEVVLVDYETRNESTIETSNAKILYDAGYSCALICCTKANDTTVFSIADLGGTAEGV